MTVRLSTGLAASMLGSYGLQAMMNYGRIEVYDGDQPISPDLPATGTKLADITTDGLAFVVGSTGGGALELEQSSSGVLGLVGTWTLTGIAEGTAGWWRWRWNAFDDGEQTFYFPRVDGLVGESLILVDPDITAITSETIESFNVQFRG